MDWSEGDEVREKMYYILFCSVVKLINKTG